MVRLLRPDANNLFRPRLDIYDPTGAPIQAPLYASDVARANFTVPADGLYTLVVTDSYDSAQSGSYSLSLLRLNRPCGAGTLSCGAPAEGSLPRALASGVYAYTAAKIGDALTVTIYPKRNGERDENPVGNTPLCVTGTAEELDHELPGLIAGYVEELGNFHSNLGQIKQQLADAATAAAEATKVKTVRKPATEPAKPAAKPAEPAEPPVARPDLFTTSMPPAAAAPETQPAPADAADGAAAICTDPRVVQPPVPSAPATQPRKRATPIRGKAVETPPLPEVAAVPIPALT